MAMSKYIHRVDLALDGVTFELIGDYTNTSDALDAFSATGKANADAPKIARIRYHRINRQNGQDRSHDYTHPSNARNAIPGGRYF